MSWRPQPARWFEVLLPRREAARAVAALARTGRVQLEPHVEALPSPAGEEASAPILERFQALCRDYGRYWHCPEHAPWPRDWGPRAALDRIEAWRRESDPHIRELQRLEQEHSRLALWREVLRAAARAGLDPSILLHEPGAELKLLVAVLPGQAALQIPAPVLHLDLPLDSGDAPAARHDRCLPMLGPLATMASLRHELRLAKGRILRRPPWLQGSGSEAREALDRRLDADDQDIERLRRVLATLSKRYAVAEAVTQLQDLAWFMDRVGSLPGSPRLAWIRGWTDAEEKSDAEEESAAAIASEHGSTSDASLSAALTDAGVHGLLHYPPPPAGLEPPLRLHNPHWARPFEVFIRLLGVPGRAEIDPSRVLALAFPLLFGYMFGDVGQGLVLMGLGLLARRRWPVTEVLVGAGGCAVLFGVLFGSVFSIEGILPALWLHPLAEPLTTLTTPLFLGAAVLFVGLLLNGVEAAWRGRGRAWLGAEAGLLLLYPSAAAAFLEPAFGWPAALGAAWAWLGRAHRRGGIAGLLAGLGETLEDIMRLFVGTISFARVGAFALAHAGLSAALQGLAAGVDSSLAAIPILVLGNLLIIALETLVVSVQGTRLMLFEFFTRFFQASGRPFRPLSMPIPDWQAR
jgi:V/A-type H+-transporting ATPase subunit I